MQLAAGHRRPGVLGTGHALAGLRDLRGVETAELRRLVVDRHAALQAIGFARRPQTRRLARIARRRALRAEEEQILREALGGLRLTALDHAQLREQARGDALAVDV